MAETATYDLPYPTDASPVDVAGDIQALAEAIDAVLPSLAYHILLMKLEITVVQLLQKGLQFM